MAARIFIDGEAGTTGLQIRSRLAGRTDVELLSLADHERKDASRRKELLNAADAVILCLPDDAAREAVAMIENPDVRVIDASTAHRVDAQWTYGFPEMSAGHAERIAASKRVSNPGCYPTGAIALIRPLVEAGLLPEDFPITVNAVSGYSGGGRKLIERVEQADAPDHIEAPFWAYGLGLEHKHVEEMRRHGLLAERPLFVPSVGRFAQGMIVQVPLQLWAVPGTPEPEAIRDVLQERYQGEAYVSLAAAEESGALERLEPESLNGTNAMRLHVFANPKNRQVLLAAVLDNLGKGASGAAVQNLNLMLGLDVDTSLPEQKVA